LDVYNFNAASYFLDADKKRMERILNERNPPNPQLVAGSSFPNTKTAPIHKQRRKRFHHVIYKNDDGYRNLVDTHRCVSSNDGLQFITFGHNGFGSRNEDARP
jgi:hypothetical protein